MNIYYNQLHSFLKPEKIEQWDFPKANQAEKKSLIAKISRTALFIFASITTVATIVLTDAAVVVWPIAGPILLITIISWLALYYLRNLEEQHTDGLDETKRAEIAKFEITNLFFEQKLGSLDLIQKFTSLNKILKSEIFSPDYIKKIEKLKDYTDKTLFEAAQESNVDLSFDQKITVFERAWCKVDWQPDTGTEYTIEASWSGKKEDEIVIKITKQVNKQLELQKMLQSMMEKKQALEKEQESKGEQPTTESASVSTTETPAEQVPEPTKENQQDVQDLLLS